MITYEIILVVARLTVTDENAVFGHKIWNDKLIDPCHLSDFTSILHLPTHQTIEVGGILLNREILESY